LKKRPRPRKVFEGLGKLADDMTDAIMAYSNSADLYANCSGSRQNKIIDNELGIDTPMPSPIFNKFFMGLRHIVCQLGTTGVA